MKKNIAKIGVGFAYFLPVVVFAQQATNIQNLLQILLNVINLLVPFLIALAVLFFVFGVVKYILNQDNEDAQKSARAIMINGIIAIFVIVSVWGLVNVLVNTFNFNVIPAKKPTLPTLQ